ncbi:MAG: hypothetical protein DRJ10_12500 [Bacteroidetes bacterium]|nr:MAG: hypothetical protein DRJ10_12500 [Bacteroidota bacterium]
MNLPHIQNDNLAEFLKKEDVIRETAAQIMKDFALFGIQILFSGKIESAYDELLEQLVSQINILLENDDKILLSVLYQVDISEKDLRKTKLDFPNYDQVEVIAHQIIARDLKKVLSRRYFKSKR